MRELVKSVDDSVTLINRIAEEAGDHIYGLSLPKDIKRTSHKLIAPLADEIQPPSSSTTNTKKQLPNGIVNQIHAAKAITIYKTTTMGEEDTASSTATAAATTTTTTTPVRSGEKKGYTTYVSKSPHPTQLLSSPTKQKDAVSAPSMKMTTMTMTPKKEMSCYTLMIGGVDAEGCFREEEEQEEQEQKQEEEAVKRSTRHGGTNVINDRMIWHQQQHHDDIFNGPSTNFQQEEQEEEEEDEKKETRENLHHHHHHQQQQQHSSKIIHNMKSVVSSSISIETRHSKAYPLEQPLQSALCVYSKFIANAMQARREVQNVNWRFRIKSQRAIEALYFSSIGRGKQAITGLKGTYNESIKRLRREVGEWADRCEKVTMEARKSSYYFQFINREALLRVTAFSDMITFFMGSNNQIVLANNEKREKKEEEEQEGNKIHESPLKFPRTYKPASMVPLISYRRQSSEKPSPISSTTTTTTTTTTTLMPSALTSNMQVLQQNNIHIERGGRKRNMKMMVGKVALADVTSTSTSEAAIRDDHVSKEKDEYYNYYTDGDDTLIETPLVELQPHPRLEYKDETEEEQLDKNKRKGTFPLSSSLTHWKSPSSFSMQQQLLLPEKGDTMTNIHNSVLAKNKGTATVKSKIIAQQGHDNIEVVGRRELMTLEPISRLEAVYDDDDDDDDNDERILREEGIDTQGEIRHAHKEYRLLYGKNNDEKNEYSDDEKIATSDLMEAMPSFISVDDEEDDDYINVDV
eukprot:jgi/Bigna1/146031/aug1.107_g20739